MILNPFNLQYPLINTDNTTVVSQNAGNPISELLNVEVLLGNPTLEGSNFSIYFYLSLPFNKILDPPGLLVS